MYLHCACICHFNTWLCQKKITTQKLEHPIEVYNINGSINRGGSITKEDYHTKDTRNVLYLRYVIWENLILSLVTHGYINIILRSTGRQEKWNDKMSKRM